MMLSSLRSRVIVSRLVQNMQRRGMAEMPVPQSSKATLFAGHKTNEGWETTMTWWYTSSLTLICLVLGTTPTTDIESWAQQEAAARLKMAEGEELEFGTHYQDVVASKHREEWDVFASKSLKFNEDDDDDDDDEDDEEEEEEEDDDE